MNNSEDLLPTPDDDKMLESLLAPLRQIEPSMEARVRQRMAVAMELQRREEKRPWWGRSLSVPVPVAAALLVAVGLALAWTHAGGQERPSQRHSEGEPGKSEGNAPRLANLHPVVAYHETEIYLLCGVGRLQTESGYFIQE